MYNKGWHGGNIFKTLQFPTTPLECPLCGNFETNQDHIIRQCPCTSLVQIRHHHIATLKINLQRSKDKYDPIVQEISELYLHTALTDPDGFQIWTGMHNTRIINLIETEINILQHDIDDKTIQKIKKAMLTISSRLAAITLRLWTKRSELLKYATRELNRRNRTNIFHNKQYHQANPEKTNKTLKQLKLPAQWNTQSSNSQISDNFESSDEENTKPKKENNLINPQTHLNEQRRHARLKRGYISTNNLIKINTLLINNNPQRSSQQSDFSLCSTRIQKQDKTENATQTEIEKSENRKIAVTTITNKTQKTIKNPKKVHKKARNSQKAQPKRKNTNKSKRTKSREQTQGNSQQIPLAHQKSTHTDTTTHYTLTTHNPPPPPQHPPLLERVELGIG